MPAEVFTQQQENEGLLQLPLFDGWLVRVVGSPRDLGAGDGLEFGEFILVFGKLALIAVRDGGVRFELPLLQGLVGPLAIDADGKTIPVDTAENIGTSPG
jgi:hypothetical protein